MATRYDELGRTPAGGATGAAGISAGQDQGGRGAVDEAKQKAGEVMDKAQHQAQDLTQKAKDQAFSQAQGQKDRAAEQLTGVADALRTTGEQLRQKEQHAFADYTEKGAAQVDRFAQYLRQNDVRQMMRGAERMARRQPELFLGGAIVLGFLGARFLKSSGEQAQQQSGGPAYQPYQMPHTAVQPAPATSGPYASSYPTPGTSAVGTAQPGGYGATGTTGTPAATAGVTAPAGQTGQAGQTGIAGEGAERQRRAA